MNSTPKLKGGLPAACVLAALLAAGPARAVSVIDADIFDGSLTVTASSTFSAFNFNPNLVVDGTTDGHVFADTGGEPQFMSITGFNASIDTLRFFDQPQFSERVAPGVTIYYSSVSTTSLVPGDYTLLGSFVLPTLNIQNDPGGGDDIYATPTFDPIDISSGNQGGNGSVINYAELTGLGIPAGTQSILLNLDNNLFGTGLSEIQAYSVIPEPSSLVLLSGVALLGLGVRRRK